MGKEQIPLNNIEHKKDFKQIRACIVDGLRLDPQTLEMIKTMSKDGFNVNYFDSVENFKKNNIKNGGEKTYVISPISQKDQFSWKYFNCMGIVATGMGKDGKRIGFMTHQNPEVSSGELNKKFEEDLISSLRELKDKTTKGSIDAVMFGGNPRNLFLDYKKSIITANKILDRELGFKPTVMTGPDFDPKTEGGTEVYFKMQECLLYIVRVIQKSNANENFLANDLLKKIEEW
ncbi:MAG: hypothetical protein WC662_01225 [Candidatus Paceibacterota bacterium]|jgi:hypothetical protein